MDIFFVRKTQLISSKKGCYRESVENWTLSNAASWYALPFFRMTYLAFIHFLYWNALPLSIPIMLIETDVPTPSYCYCITSSHF